MRNLRSATAAAAALALSALTLGTSSAAASVSASSGASVARGGPSGQSAVAAIAAGAETTDAPPAPLLAAADLELALYSTHPMASKAGNTYAPGTNGNRFCHPPGVSVPGAVTGSDDVDGDGFCPHGQFIRDLEFTSSGRLIATYGDIGTNTDTFGPIDGRIAIVPLNIETGVWEDPFLVRSEMTRVIRKLANGELAIPLIDPSSRGGDGPQPSGYASDKGGTWHIVKPGSIWFNHAEDLAETPSGDIWLFGSGGEGNAAGIIARTTDGGATWELMKQTQTPGRYLRYTRGSAVGSTVYASGPLGMLEPVKYDGTSWDVGGIDVTCEYYKATCVSTMLRGANFFDGERTVTSALPRLLGPDPGKNAQQYFYPYHPQSSFYAATDGYLYAVADGVLMRTDAVGGAWEVVGQYRDMQDVGAFAVFGDRVYFGGTGGRIYRAGLTVTQAVQASKDAQERALAEQVRLVAPLKDEIAAAEAEVVSNLSADAAEDSPAREPVIKDAEGVVARETARVQALAAEASPLSWAALSREYEATNAAVADFESRHEPTMQERSSYWKTRSAERMAQIRARTARMDRLIAAIPAPYDAAARAMKEESRLSREQRETDAANERRQWWGRAAMLAHVSPVTDAHLAAGGAAMKVRALVDAEAKHRSQVAAAEATRTVSVHTSRFGIYERFMDRENKASLALARARPATPASVLAAQSNRMARVVDRELPRARSLKASELARADRVTATERGRATSADWAGLIAREVPSTSPLSAAHREVLLKRVAADRDEQDRSITADAAVRASTVATYGEVRERWWSELGRTVTQTDRMAELWARHDRRVTDYIDKVREQEKARAATLKAGPPLSARQKAAERKRLQERVNRLKAWSRTVNIEDFKTADSAYEAERKRLVALYYEEHGQGAKVAADRAAWVQRNRATYYARAGRAYALNQQWRSRISADRYARDAASNDLMRFAPK